jgi:hypothetical protein
MEILVSLLGLGMALFLPVVAYLAARWGVAVLAGIPGAWAPFRRFDVPRGGAPWWARPAVAAAGPVATYLIASFAFTVAMKLMPTPVYGTHVDVKPGEPAEAAGIRSGDRLISIGGQPVATFSEISSRIRSVDPGASVEIVFEQGGVQKATTVKPKAGIGGQPKIGVISTPARYVPTSMMEAVTGGIALPAQWASGMHDVMAGKETLAGPIGIMASGPGVSPISTTARGFLMSGFSLLPLGALLWLLTPIFALFGWRPHPRDESKGASAQGA